MYASNFVLGSSRKQQIEELNDRCDSIADDADRHYGQAGIPTVTGLDQCFQALKCHSGSMSTVQMSDIPEQRATRP